MESPPNQLDQARLIQIKYQNHVIGILKIALETTMSTNQIYNASKKYRIRKLYLSCKHLRKNKRKQNKQNDAFLMKPSQNFEEITRNKIYEE